MTTATDFDFAGFSPSASAAWIALGVSADVADHLDASGISPELAAERYDRHGAYHETIAQVAMAETLPMAALVAVLELRHGALRCPATAGRMSA